MKRHEALILWYSQTKIANPSPFINTLLSGEFLASEYSDGVVWFIKTHI